MERWRGGGLPTPLPPEPAVRGEHPCRRGPRSPDPPCSRGSPSSASRPVNESRENRSRWNGLWDGGKAQEGLGRQLWEEARRVVACRLCPLVVSAIPAWWSSRRLLACQLKTGPQTSLEVLPGPGASDFLHPFFPSHHSRAIAIPRRLLCSQIKGVFSSFPLICWN